MPTVEQSRDRVSVHNVHFIVSAAEDVGIDREQLLAEAGIRPPELVDPQGRIDYERVSRLWGISARLAGDEAYGLHLAERLEAHHYGVMGLAVRSSQSARMALDLVLEYTRRALPDTGVSLVREGARSRFQHRYLGDPRRAQRYVADLMLATFVIGGRGFIGLDFDPIEVTFRHEATDYLDEYRRIFRAPVHFGAEVNSVVFDDALLDRPMVKADPELLAVIRDYVEAFLKTLSAAGDMSEKARKVIASALVHGDPSLATTAASIGLTPRTLQRRLREEGTSHSELVDGVRCDLALQLLERPGVSVEQASDYLGFSETSAFHRAFRRWTGSTPAAYRTRHRRTPGAPHFAGPGPAR